MCGIRQVGVGLRHRLAPVGLGCSRGGSWEGSGGRWGMLLAGNPFAFARGESVVGDLGWKVLKLLIFFKIESSNCQIVQIKTLTFPRKD